MQSVMYKCRLSSVESRHPPIDLPHGVPVKIGRTPQTQIKDKRCSREQLQLTANYNKQLVEVRQLGANSSAVDEWELEQGQTTPLKPGQTLYVLSRQYPYTVRFQDNREALMSSEPRTSAMKTSTPAVAREKHSKPPSSARDKSTSKHVQSKLDVHLKPEKTSPNGKSAGSMLKRKSEGSLGAGDPKKRKTDDKAEVEKEDEEHVNSVAEKLKRLKEEAKSGDSKKAPSEGRGQREGPSKTEARQGDVCQQSGWSRYDSLYVYNFKGQVAREKVAAFDIDGTIIIPKSGKKFPVDSGDWKILYPEIFGKLKKLHADGYKIVFFTNQKGVLKKSTKIEDLQEKFVNVVHKLGIPIQIFVATSGGKFRKPCLGMWDYFRKQANRGVPVKVEESFYVGDAAGRPEKWAPGRKKDFSSSDRLFALNANLKFYTPEEFFQGHKQAPFVMPEFDPRKLSASDPLTDPPKARIASDKTEVIVFVGFPASGKSFFAKEHLVQRNGYVHVNRDNLGSWQKCVQNTEKALAAGRSVVVDNLNPDAESRARYVECAKKAGVPCRCFRFTASFTQCRHNEKFRELTDSSHQPVNEMIMNSYKKKIVEPQLSEGYTEIVKVNFVPKFSKEKHERLYRQFLLDK